MGSERELINQVNSLSKELENIQETLFILYSSDCLSEKAIEIFQERGHIFDLETLPIKKAREYLLSLKGLNPGDVIICPKCDITIEISREDSILILGDKVELTPGCPYCGRKTLDLITI